MQIDERVKAAMVELTQARKEEEAARRRKEDCVSNLRTMVDRFHLAPCLSDHLGIEVTERAAESLVLSGVIDRMLDIEAEVKALRNMFGTLVDIRMTAAPFVRHGEYPVRLDVSTIASGLVDAAHDALSIMVLIIPVEVNP
jgi:hypothetical protein